MNSLLPSLWGHSEKGESPFRSLHQEIDKVFEDFNRSLGMPVASRASGAKNGFVTPHIDVVETDNAVELTAELPGVAEKDIDVTLVDDVLTIKGEKKVESSEEKKDYRIVERSFGSFQRSIRLPFAVEPDKVEASFKDGVLHVVLPKPPEVESKSKKIAITSTAD